MTHGGSTFCNKTLASYETSKIIKKEKRIAHKRNDKRLKYCFILTWTEDEQEGEGKNRPHLHIRVRRTFRIQPFFTIATGFTFTGSTHGDVLWFKIWKDNDNGNNKTIPRYHFNTDKIELIHSHTNGTLRTKAISVARLSVCVRFYFYYFLYSFTDMHCTRMMCMCVFRLWILFECHFHTSGAGVWIQVCMPYDCVSENIQLLNEKRTKLFHKYSDKRKNIFSICHENRWNI